MFSKIGDFTFPNGETSCCNVVIPSPNFSLRTCNLKREHKHVLLIKTTVKKYTGQNRASNLHLSAHRSFCSRFLESCVAEPGLIIDSILFRSAVSTFINLQKHKKT